MKLNLISLFGLVTLCLMSMTGIAQSEASTRPSPAAQAKGFIHGAQIDIHYSSPAVKGRVIWGDLVPYGKVWRTGANEATTFETDKTLTINDKKLPAGKYALFTIPGETEWTFIFNSVWDQWGAFNYDESKDVLRVTAVPVRIPVVNERLMFEVKDNKVILSWESLTIPLEIKK